MMPMSGGLASRCTEINFLQTIISSACTLTYIPPDFAHRFGPFRYPPTCSRLSDYDNIQNSFISGMSSSRGDFHPPALTEPYVKLSLHTALTMQPLSITALRFAPKSSRLVAPLPYAAWFTPFAPFPLQKFLHYYGMIRPCGVRWYSMSCRDCPLDTFPSHHPDRFPRSI